MQTECTKCGSLFCDTDAARLWDGLVYCRTCVDAADPRLFAFAKEHTVLHDRIHHSLLGHITVMSLVLAPSIWLAISREVSTGFVVLVAAGPLFAFLVAWWVVSRVWSVSVHDGVLVDDTWPMRRDMRLSECSWRVARYCVWYDDFRAISMFSPGSKLCLRPMRRVGTARDLFWVWRAFLELAGVPKCQYRRFPVRKEP